MDRFAAFTLRYVAVHDFTKYTDRTQRDAAAYYQTRCIPGYVWQYYGERVTAERAIAQFESSRDLASWLADAILRSEQNRRALEIADGAVGVSVGVRDDGRA